MIQGQKFTIKVEKWRISPEDLTIKGPNGVLSLGPRMMDLLLYFIKNQGRIITHEELLREVWSDVMVSESTIRKSISNLKACFVINGQQVVHLDNFRQRGYKLSEKTSIRFIKNTQWVTAYPILQKAGVVIAGLALVSVFFLPLNRLADKQSSQIIVKPNAISPHQSQDGQQIVYVTSHSTLQGITNDDIYGYDSNNGTHQKILASSDSESDPILAPSGKKLAYVRNGGSGSEIWMLDFITSKNRRLIEISEVPFLHSMDWHPDEKTLIYSTRKSVQEPFTLYELNTESMAIKQLTSPHPNILGDHNPKVSPDGNLLAFLRFRKTPRLYYVQGGTGDIFLMNLKSGQINKLTDFNAEISGLDWSIDGQSLYYITSRFNQRFDINQIGLNGDFTNNIYTSHNLLRNLSIGDKITFEERALNFFLMSGDITYNSPVNFNYQELSQDKYWNAQFSNTSDAIAYVSTESGTPEIWVKRSPDADAMKLTSFEGPQIGRPQWSSDDRRLIFSVKEKGNSDLYLIDLKSGEVRPFLNSSFNETNPVWVNNSKTVMFSADYNGKNQIWEKSFFSKGNPALLEDISSHFFLAYDKDIFYAKNDPPGLRKRNTTTGKDELITDQLFEFDLENWNLDDEHLYYVRSSEEPPYRYLHKKNLTTGIDSRICEMGCYSLNHPGISISARGESFITVNSTSGESMVKSIDKHH